MPALGILCGWIQAVDWMIQVVGLPLNKQVFHGPTQIHLTFMFSKCATIRMRREKEMEQNLESWIHLRACGFLLCLQSSDSLGDSQPCGHEAKNPPCAPGGQNAARALRFKDFAHGLWDTLEKLISCSLIIFPLVLITENNIAKQNIRKSIKHCKRYKKKAPILKIFPYSYFFLSVCLSKLS